MNKIVWSREGAPSQAPANAGFSAFIVKIASRCNLNCDYCYVYHGPDQSWRTRPKFMDTRTAVQTFKRIAEHAVARSLDEVSITLHGGEPFLSGHERLEEYLRLAQDNIPTSIRFGMQTNATLATPEILDCLAKYDVRVGISIDGPKAVNDKHRVFRNGKGSHDRLMAGIQLFKSRPEWAALVTGYLSVIDIKSDPEETFSFLNRVCDKGIDILLPDCNWAAPPPRMDEDTDQTGYGRWMAKFFDSWSHSGSDVQVRYFEEIIAMKFGIPSIMENIGAQFVDFIIIEADGEIEGVDTLKMVSREATKLGLNVFENSLDQALEKPAIFSRMVGYESLCETCQSCSLLEQCGGGLPATSLPQRDRICESFGVLQ